MAKYHIVLTGDDDALCVAAGRGTYDEENDVLVPEDEANDPNGHYFNCTDCSYVQHGGRRHVEPIAGYVFPGATT